MTEDTTTRPARARTSQPRRDGDFQKPRSAGFDARRGPGRAKKARAEAEPFIRRAIPEIDTPFTRMGIDPRVAINLP